MSKSSKQDEISIGRATHKDARILSAMNVDVQAHHALIDGVHVGWFYEHVQELLSDPGIFLSEA